MTVLTVWALTLEVTVTIVRFVLGFYAFWLVLRALEGLLSEETDALRELDPLACDFTDPFVVPLSRLLHLAPRFTSWLWLAIFAALQVGLDRVPGLV